MFGQGGGSKRDNKGPTINIKLAISLEDIYNGKTVEIFMTKQ
jgi:DnaJ-class molecular chaperone